jgi:hypothetical protein
MQPQRLHSGHHREIPSLDRGGFSPTISSPNPVEVPTVPYENLFNGGLGGLLSG